MDDIAALEAATLPGNLAATAIANAEALVAKLSQLSTEIVDFQQLMSVTLGDHPARHEVIAPAEEGRGLTWEARSHVEAVIEKLHEIPGLLHSALQRRDALVTTLRM